MVTINPAAIQAAQQQEIQRRIWASVQLAQFGLESAWGTKVTGPFNFWGIKAIIGQPYTTVVTHEFLNGRYQQVNANFANYSSFLDSFAAHAQLLATHPAYAAARATTSAEAFAQALTGHYATDPLYGQKLITIMRESKLEQYDHT